VIYLLPIPKCSYVLLYTEKPVPRSKELVAAQDDSSKKARLQKIQILDTETHLLLQLITPVREDWIKLERERER
jgi:hypothetical protein